ncbi:MAG: flagellar protein [Halanaerobium sp.]|jgi:flagellar operon protein (TIGR03826 family)|nr:MAG: flagellar protein [Halanaerobium sp. T82-1]PUU89025.1 MAG: flagellar protein [Halanaerobium sp.]
MEITGRLKMNLINCQECGKVFASAGSKVCPDCRQSEEEKFELVKEYLWDHPNSTVPTVSEATGVKETMIIKFIKEDRLQSEGLDIEYSLKCKTCGREIESGVYCDSCRNKLINDFNSNPKEKEEEKVNEHEKMFLGDRFKRD